LKPALKNAIRRHRPNDILQFAVHLPDFVRLFLRLLGDARVALSAKALMVAAVGYVLSPVDLLPDMLVMLGAVDDLALLGMACKLFIQLCPRTVVAEHVARLDNSGRWRPFE
jgi:uncharacterized membrane protein YkvA (DUF1232 family)